MDQKKSPRDDFKNIFGVDITDAGAMRAHFNMKARAVEMPPPAPGSEMSKALHQGYFRLYKLSRKLVAALEKVMQDSEHRLVMEEARELGYELPDREKFQARIEDYKAFLKNHQTGKVGDSLQDLADRNCDMVGDIFSRCFKTEYMKHFGFLRRSGFHYAGATALQEAVNIVVAMRYIKGQIDDLRDQGPPSYNPPHNSGPVS